MIDDSDLRALFRSSFANLLRRAGDAFGDRVALVHRGKHDLLKLKAMVAGDPSPNVGA